jgi:hypothetical protein
VIAAKEWRICKGIVASSFHTKLSVAVQTVNLAEQMGPSYCHWDKLPQSCWCWHWTNVNLMLRRWRLCTCAWRSQVPHSYLFLPVWYLGLQARVE